MDNHEMKPIPLGNLSRVVTATAYPVSVIMVSSLYGVAVFGVHLEFAAVITVVGAAFFVPVAYRCACALQRRGQRGEPTVIALWSAALLCVYLCPATTLGWAGDYQRMLGLAMVWLLPVNTISFFAAGANVHEVDCGRVPSGWSGVDVLYALGGVLGVGVARRAFGREEIYALPKGLPGVAVVGSIIALVAFPALHRGPWFFGSVWHEITGLPWPR